ncbi:hypothetical protein MRB53_040917 [Persea americana]|nr:hypothetical protein MRB53_040917 [Persea americana]
MGIFSCVPVTGGGRWSVLEGDVGDSTLSQEQLCVGYQYLYILNTSMNSFVELSTAILALIFVAKVRATTAQKVGLTITFMLGLITIIASAVATAYFFAGFHQVKDMTPMAILAGQRKFFYSNIWGAVEIYMGVFIASILPLRALLMRTWSKISKKIKDSSARSLSHGCYTSSNRTEVTGESGRKSSVYTVEDVLEIQPVLTVKYDDGNIGAKVPSRV